jgi:hypothetical protein
MLLLKEKTMNHFRKVAQLCKEIQAPVGDAGALDDEAYAHGYAQGQYNLAQIILTELSLASKKTEDFSI